MIRKSILTALVLLAVYHFLLPHLPRKFYQILGQQRDNYLQAQRYVLEIPERTNVIVGSSMAGELNDNILGPSYFKLTLPGNSVFTALEIIRKAGKRPNVILIETNVLWRDADPELLHDLFSPWLLQLRRLSPIFREEGRPANLVGGIAEACVRRGSQLGAWAFSGRKSGFKPSAPAGRLTPEAMSRVMRLNEQEWDHVPPPSLLAKQSAELGEYVDRLNRDGSKCVLFEMPMAPSLAKLAMPRMWRQAIGERFPRENYRWLIFEGDHIYETKDGVHLVRSEADNLTRTIVDQVNLITYAPEASEPVRHAIRDVKR